MPVQRDMKLRKRRTGKPKRRTGCVTCKIRRVKCDETKPSCLRCQKFGTECDGYKPPQSAKKASCTKIILPIITPDFRPLFYQPRTTLFKSDQEHRYFKVFCERTAFQLSGYFDSTLWRRLVLQACENDPSIRHAVIAIAALDSTLVASRSPLGNNESNNAKQHHQFALVQYSKAIRRMRDASSKGRQDLRTTLITSLVIICFETFHGNHESAFAQVRTGLDLIEDWFNQSIQSRGDVIGVMSPLPNVIEDELIHAFARLDIQTMSFVDDRSIESHLHMKNHGLRGITSMPQVFTTLREARIYLELVMQRLMHYLAAIQKQWWASGCIYAGVILSIPDIVEAERVKYHGELERWYAAFHPFLSENTRLPTQLDYLGATALHLHYLATLYGIIGRITTKQQVDRRPLMPLFEKQVACAKAILDHPDMARDDCPYTFDLQVIVPLYVVAWQCPYGPLRREAIDLLLSRPRREGIWDGMLAGKMGEWIMQVEEEGLEGDYVPEDGTILALEMKYDMHARTAWFQCEKRVKGSSQGEKKSAVMNW